MNDTDPRKQGAAARANPAGPDSTTVAAADARFMHEFTHDGGDGDARHGGQHGTDGADGHDDLAEDPSRGRTRRHGGAGMLLFAAIAVAAFASLWSMRAISRASAAESQSSEASRVVETFLTERARPAGVDPSLDAPSSGAAPLPVGDPTEIQVPREHLARNPFAFPWRTAAVASSPAESTAPLQPGADPASRVADPASRAAELAARVAELASRVAAWEREVDDGARDFVVESMLVATDPANSIVSMNGGVFRIGESVTFPGHAVRYEIRSVDAHAIVLRAYSQELAHERIVTLVVREPR